MEAKTKTFYVFDNLVLVSLKKYRPKRADGIEGLIRHFAKRKKMRIGELSNGWVMPYTLAKIFATHLHFNCAHRFTLGEVLTLQDQKIVTKDDIDSAQVTVRIA